MKLDFPLNYYDEAGRLKPPGFLYVGLAFLCRGFLLLIVSVSVGEQGEALMEVFYPSRTEFYYSLLPAILGMLAFLILSKRQTLWKRKRYYFFSFLIPVIIIATVIDLGLQIYISSQRDFLFSVSKAVTLTFVCVFGAYLITNRQIKMLTKDWKKPN